VVDCIGLCHQAVAMPRYRQDHQVVWLTSLCSQTDLLPSSVNLWQHCWFENGHMVNRPKC